jgi:hypothetical protein
MKIFYFKANAKGEYNDAGMTDRGLTGDYKLLRGFFVMVFLHNFYGKMRLQVFYGENIYRSPDKVIYVTV